MKVKLWPESIALSQDVLRNLVANGHSDRTKDLCQRIILGFGQSVLYNVVMEWKLKKVVEYI